MNDTWHTELEQDGDHATHKGQQALLTLYNNPKTVLTHLNLGEICDHP